MGPGPARHTSFLTQIIQLYLLPTWVTYSPSIIVGGHAQLHWQVFLYEGAFIFTPVISYTFLHTPNTQNNQTPLHPCLSGPIFGKYRHLYRYGGSESLSLINVNNRFVSANRR